MTTRLTLEPFGFAMQVDDTMVDIAGMWRPGTRTPLVFLHGFGSTKEDYADVVQQVHLADHAVLAFDAPGCGATACSKLDGLSIPFLVDVADRVLANQDVGRFYLIGHSMGGLVGLLLAERHPARVVGFVNIEGNLAPEDCVFSRQIISDFDPASEGSFGALRDRVGGQARTPARCSPQASSTRSIAKLCGPCASRWSTSPTTRACSRVFSTCRSRAC